MNSQDFRNLSEAYLNVYENEQLDEMPYVRKVEEETDIFDYVMEYLISEGYADNEEAAESIMVNMGEEWIHTIVEKFSMAANPSKPQSPKLTKLPRSREKKIVPHDDWKDKPTEWGELPPAAKKLKTRAITVVGTQKRQDIETGVR